MTRLISINDNKTVFIEESDRPICICGSNKVASSGMIERIYKDIGRNIIVQRQRYKCSSCKKTFFAENDQLDIKGKRTVRYIEFMKTGEVLPLKSVVFSEVKRKQTEDERKKFPTIFQWSKQCPFKWVQNRSVK